MSKLPTLARVRELFDYDPVTGIVRRRIATSNRLSGAAVGTARKNEGRLYGYLVVTVDRAEIRLHRLIFFYMTGRWPVLIDHINGNGIDNRWENLREADQWQNNWNKPGHGQYLKGTQPHGEKWVSKITLKRKQIHLGSFATEEEAHAAYCSKAKELFGDFARF